MSTTTPAEVSSIASRSIEAGRVDRAVTSPMDVSRVCDRLYRVTHAGETYDVDLEGGACSCPDAEYRPEFVCKHAIRAALVARVVGFARENDCPHGHEFCDGPVGPRLPCPGCIDAVRSPGVDEWTVWTRAVTEDRA